MTSTFEAAGHGGMGHGVAGMVGLWGFGSETVVEVTKLNSGQVETKSSKDIDMYTYVYLVPPAPGGTCN